MVARLMQIGCLPRNLQHPPPRKSTCAIGQYIGSQFDDDSLCFRHDFASRERVIEGNYNPEYQRLAWNKNLVIFSCNLLQLQFVALTGFAVESI